MSAIYKPRRLRIVEPGFESVTDRIGLVDFVDGVSTQPVNYQEASIIGANFRTEDADESGYQISPAATMDRFQHTTIEDDVVRAFGAGEHVNLNGGAVMERFTLTELEAIADRNGLSGVRDIARAWGETGRSIKECIDAILTAQGAGTTAPVGD